MGRPLSSLTRRITLDSELLDATTRLVRVLQERYGGWEGVKQLGDTPERIARMYQEFCWSSVRIEEDLEQQFRVFEQAYNEMLVIRPIDVWTLCPHHLLPCHFKVTVGYIPNGRVLGLSKFARIADILARRPVLQEQYSTELADLLMAKLEPKGVAVHVEGSHGCMTARGVKQHSEVITSTIRGVFESDSSTRQEFFAICRS